MQNIRVLIFGSGRRVKHDLFPVLINLRIDASKIAVVRRSGRRESWHSESQVYSFEEVNQKLEVPDIVFICVPPPQIVSCLEAISMSGYGGQVFIDTPISIGLEEILKYQSRFKMNVLEDNGLLPFIPEMHKVDYRFRLIFNWRSFYNYHGVAFFRAVLNGTMTVCLSKRLGRFRVLVLTGFRTLVISVTPYNYNKGSLRLFEIKGLRRLLVVSDLAEFSTRAKFYSGLQASDFKADSPLISVDKTLRLKPVEFMNDWKRMGLFIGIESFLKHGQMLFPSIQESFKNEKPFLR